MPDWTLVKKIVRNWLLSRTELRHFLTFDIGTAQKMDTKPIPAAKMVLNIIDGMTGRLSGN